MGKANTPYLLLSTKWTALAGVVLTAFVAIPIFRNAFVHFPRAYHAHWVFPLDWLLPKQWSLIVSVIFYAWVLFLCLSFSRITHGKERIFVVGWFPGMLLAPLKGLFPALAEGIQVLEVIGITVALMESILIFREEWLGKVSPAA